MKTFSKEVREAVARGQRGYCYLCTNKIDDFHHKLSNTKTYNKMFPKFIHSIWNCVGICRRCHEQEKHVFNLPLDLVREYEAELTIKNTEYTK